MAGELTRRYITITCNAANAKHDLFRSMNLSCRSMMNCNNQTSRKRMISDNSLTCIKFTRYVVMSFLRLEFLILRAAYCKMKSINENNKIQFFFIDAFSFHHIIVIDQTDDFDVNRP